MHFSNLTKYTDFKLNIVLDQSYVSIAFVDIKSSLNLRMDIVGLVKGDMWLVWGEVDSSLQASASVFRSNFSRKFKPKQLSGELPTKHNNLK